MPKPLPALAIDPAPLFDLSPYLYMQFMEPLGATDGSVEAGWDFQRECWRDDLVEVTRELAPTLLRWGGCFASYYRWREGVGPRTRRKPMLNLLWGGTESNQVGTHEFVDFCRQVGADPLMVVNFESDGRRHWARPRRGGLRSGSAREAADWVDYCNSPANAARRRNGARKPLRIPLWQIGNETSYDPNGFDCEAAAVKTVRFARAMRRADPTIRLIGWGDSGWAPRMLEVAGEHLDYLAFHHGLRSTLPDSPLRGQQWRKSPAATWRHLMSAAPIAQTRIDDMRQQVAGHDIPLAKTECHFGLPGRNRCEVLSTWAAGVANARVLNVHERNGDILKIATLADFCGTRWMNNAVIIPVPGGTSFMMPVARVMALYRHHVGAEGIGAPRVPAGLDVAASRSGNTVFLHVVNARRTRSVRVRLAVAGHRIASGRIFEIADDPMREVEITCRDIFAPRKHTLPRSRAWQFPAASVSAVELRIRPDA